MESKMHIKGGHMNKQDLKDGMIVRTRGIKDEYYEFYILKPNFQLYYVQHATHA